MIKKKRSHTSASSRRGSQPTRSGKLIRLSPEEAFKRAAKSPPIPDLKDEQIDLSDIPLRKSKSRNGVRGKYYEAISTQVGFVRLDPDVRKVFADPEAVNQALRSLITIAGFIGPRHNSQTKRRTA